MISPLLPFTGGLRNQAVEILSILVHYAGEREHDALFCDPFFGGGSISYEAKRNGFAISANDLAARSFYPARALIANDDLIQASVVSTNRQ